MGATNSGEGQLVLTPKATFFREANITESMLKSYCFIKPVVTTNLVLPFGPKEISIPKAFHPGGIAFESAWRDYSKMTIKFHFGIV